MMKNIELNQSIITIECKIENAQFWVPWLYGLCWMSRSYQWFFIIDSFFIHPYTGALSSTAHTQIQQPNTQTLDKAKSKDRKSWSVEDIIQLQKSRS